MIARAFLVHALLFASGALATINEKGIIFFCTAANNAQTADGVMGTQVNLGLKNVAAESLSSICGNLNKYIKNKKNGIGGEGINCATNGDATMMVGAHVPQDIEKTGADAADLVKEALRTVLEGDIDQQLFNADNGNNCLVVDFDQSAVDANAGNTDTSTIYPGAPIQITENSPIPFTVDSVKTSKTTMGLSIPDPATVMQNIGPITDSLSAQAQTAGVTDMPLPNSNLRIKVMFDAGGPFGLSGTEASITAESWKLLISQIVATLANGGNHDACLLMTASAPKVGNERNMLAIVLQFCYGY